jgi:hypothetical protein
MPVAFFQGWPLRYFRFHTHFYNRARRLCLRELSHLQSFLEVPTEISPFKPLPFLDLDGGFTSETTALTATRLFRNRNGYEFMKFTCNGHHPTETSARSAMEGKGGGEWGVAITYVFMHSFVYIHM